MGLSLNAYHIYMFVCLYLFLSLYPLKVEAGHLGLGYTPQLSGLSV